MITAATSGGLGDIIYSIPIMKELGVTDVWVKENYYFPPHGNLYLSIREILMMNGFNVHPTGGQWPPTIFDPELMPKIRYNMDLARRQPKRNVRHITVSYANEFQLANQKYFQKPWLTVEGESMYPDLVKPYTLITLTDRWRRNSPVDWAKVRERIQGPLYFIGFAYEYADFQRMLPKTDRSIAYLPTPNLLETARLIRDCQALYTNQTAAVTIAQGLGKDYYLEVNPGKTNVLIYTPNEHIL